MLFVAWTTSAGHSIAMEWEPIVSQLDGRQPALIVDGGGRVRFMNAPMEKLLGRRVDELSTTRWLALCAQPGGTSAVKHLLGAAFRGEATGGDLPAAHARGAPHHDARGALARSSRPPPRARRRVAGRARSGGRRQRRRRLLVRGGPHRGRRRHGHARALPRSEPGRPRVRGEARRGAPRAPELRPRDAMGR